MTQETSKQICLDQFLKFAALVETGGIAKFLIQDGQIHVNGEVETRRRRKLKPEDIVTFDGQDFNVCDIIDSSPPSSE